MKKNKNEKTQSKIESATKKDSGGIQDKDKESTEIDGRSGRQRDTGGE